MVHEAVEFKDHPLGFEGTDRDCKIVSAWKRWQHGYRNTPPLTQNEETMLMLGARKPKKIWTTQTTLLTHYKEKSVNAVLGTNNHGLPWQPHETQPQCVLVKRSGGSIGTPHTLPSYCEVSIHALRRLTSLDTKPRGTFYRSFCTIASYVYLWWLCDSYMCTESFRLAKVWYRHSVLKYGNSNRKNRNNLSPQKTEE